MISTLAFRKEFKLCVNNVSSLPDADLRLTVASLLAQQKYICQRTEDADAARRRVVTPKPLACDIEAIESQYAADEDWPLITTQMEQARPYTLPRSKYDMSIDTGHMFAITLLQKIMAPQRGKHHGNDAPEHLYSTFEIGQVSKLHGGNLRIKVKSKDLCIALEHTKVNILGGEFMSKTFDVIGGKHFVDISNIDWDTKADVMLRRLFLMDSNPVYITLRKVNLATGITSAT